MVRSLRALQPTQLSVGVGPPRPQHPLGRERDGVRLAHGDVDDVASIQTAGDDAVRFSRILRRRRRRVRRRRRGSAKLPSASRSTQLTVSVATPRVQLARRRNRRRVARVRRHFRDDDVGERGHSRGRRSRVRVLQTQPPVRAVAPRVRDARRPGFGRHRQHGRFPGGERGEFERHRRRGVREGGRGTIARVADAELADVVAAERVPERAHLVASFGRLPVGGANRLGKGSPRHPGGAVRPPVRGVLRVRGDDVDGSKRPRGETQKSRQRVVEFMSDDDSNVRRAFGI